MKHKHYDMIVAKAENMELVVFYKLPCEEWWQSESESTTLPDEDDIEYFLCLPKHKKAVLNTLNGGESQVASISSGWLSANCGDPVEWGGEWWYMNPNGESRIKPKKEKRWVVVNPTGNSVNVNLMKTTPDISEYPEGCQAVEIEVEV
ncbi:hypothetical protein NVP1248O_06 [Vibrio phage 1.248.O._10N.261.54.F1]|nr:hypothetical protein NVP1248O_06 [Vibrio phage 1.248.O._10N.261.54.F1]